MKTLLHVVLSAAVLSLMVLPSCTSDRACVVQQGPDEPPLVEYFPLAVGNWWKYMGPVEGGDSTVYTDSIVAFSGLPFGMAVYKTMRHRLTYDPDSREIIAEEFYHGAYEVRNERIVYWELTADTSTYVLLDGPLEVGKNWLTCEPGAYYVYVYAPSETLFAGCPGWEDDDFGVVVTAYGTVTVPAGSFSETYDVRRIEYPEPTILQGTYASGIGCIRLRSWELVDYHIEPSE